MNVAALSLHRESTFGVFHALAVVSLVTIGVGLVPLLSAADRRRSSRPTRTAWRGRTPVSSQRGAANSRWLSVRVIEAWAVPVVIGTVLAISGVIIFGRVPSILDHQAG